MMAVQLEVFLYSEVCKGVQALWHPEKLSVNQGHNRSLNYLGVSCPGTGISCNGCSSATSQCIPHLDPAQLSIVKIIKCHTHIISISAA